MSRIGKLPIDVPSNVKVNINNNEINVEGSKGKLDLAVNYGINLNYNDNQVVVTRKFDTKELRSLHGLYRMLIQNMVTGVDKGFKKALMLVGTGYKATVEGKKLVLNIGYSYPYTFNIPEGLNISVENNTKIVIEGVDKQSVGQAAAVIRKMRPPEPYKGKGIKYENEIIRRKAGKAAK